MQTFHIKTSMKLKFVIEREHIAIRFHLFCVEIRLSCYFVTLVYKSALSKIWQSSYFFVVNFIYNSIRFFRFSHFRSFIMHMLITYKQCKLWNRFTFSLKVFIANIQILRRLQQSYTCHTPRSILVTKLDV